MANERIIAIGLLTQRDLEALGSGFQRVWPVDQTPCFSQLLQAIDDADREVWRERDQSERNGPQPSPQVLNVPNRA